MHTNIFSSHSRAATYKNLPETGSNFWLEFSAPDNSFFLKNEVCRVLNYLFPELRCVSFCPLSILAVDDL